MVCVLAVWRESIVFFKKKPFRLGLLEQKLQVLPSLGDVAVINFLNWTKND